jgi:hypothetical protein
LEIQDSEGNHDGNKLVRREGWLRRNYYFVAVLALQAGVSLFQTGPCLDQNRNDIFRFFLGQLFKGMET